MLIWSNQRKGNNQIWFLLFSDVSELEAGLVWILVTILYSKHLQYICSIYLNLFPWLKDNTMYSAAVMECTKRVKLSQYPHDNWTKGHVNCIHMLVHMECYSIKDHLTCEKPCSSNYYSITVTGRCPACWVHSHKSNFSLQFTSVTMSCSEFVIGSFFFFPCPKNEQEMESFIHFGTYFHCRGKSPRNKRVMDGLSEGHCTAL